MRPITSQRSHYESVDRIPTGRSRQGDIEDILEQSLEESLGIQAQQLLNCHLCLGGQQFPGCLIEFLPELRAHTLVRGSKNIVPKDSAEQSMKGFFTATGSLPQCSEIPAEKNIALALDGLTGIA